MAEGGFGAVLHHATAAASSLRRHFIDRVLQVKAAAVMNEQEKLISQLGDRSGLQLLERNPRFIIELKSF